MRMDCMHVRERVMMLRDTYGVNICTVMAWISMYGCIWKCKPRGFGQEFLGMRN